MRITLEWPFRTFSGTQDEMTYMSFRKGNLCLGRRWEKQEKNLNNASLGSISQNLKMIWDNASPAYKNDLKQYAKKFKAQKLKSCMFPPAAYVIFLSLMYAWKQTNSEQINLATVTLSDITYLNAPVCSVARAVNAQLVAPVKGWVELVAQL